MRLSQNVLAQALQWLDLILHPYNRIILSPEPETMRVPSWENATDETQFSVLAEAL